MKKNKNWKFNFFSPAKFRKLWTYSTSFIVRLVLHQRGVCQYWTDLSAYAILNISIIDINGRQEEHWFWFGFVVFDFDTIRISVNKFIKIDKNETFGCFLRREEETSLTKTSELWDQSASGVSVIRKWIEFFFETSKDKRKPVLLSHNK